MTKVIGANNFLFDYVQGPLPTKNCDIKLYSSYVNHLYSLLCRTSNRETEFNFDADKYDIQIRANASEKTRACRAITPESSYSLRVSANAISSTMREQISFIQ